MAIVITSVAYSPMCVHVCTCLCKFDTSCVGEVGML